MSGGRGGRKRGGALADRVADQLADEVPVHRIAATCGVRVDQVLAVIAAIRKKLGRQAV